MMCAFWPSAVVYVRTRHGESAYSKTIEYQADIVSFLCAKLGRPVLELPRLAT